MINYIEAIYSLLGKHGNALQEFAFHEGNGKVFKLSIQLGRLRTDAEQRALLEESRIETLEELKALDEGPNSMVFYTSNLLPHSTMSLKEVSEGTQRFIDVFRPTNVLKTSDFTDLLELDLADIPKGNIIHSVFESYKDYAVGEFFLEKICATLDFLDSNEEGEKLSVEQLQKVTETDDLKETLASLVHKAVEPLYDIDRPQQVVPSRMKAAQAAKYINLSLSSLYKLTSAGQITFYKPAKHLQFLKEDLDKWLDEGGKNS